MVFRIKGEPDHVAQLVNLMEQGKISSRIAKEIFGEMFDTGKMPDEIVRERGLEQISDDSLIEQVIKEVISENPQAVQDYKAGKKQALGFLVGQVMKKTKGKANPQIANQKIAELLDKEVQ